MDAWAHISRSTFIAAYRITSQQTHISPLITPHRQSGSLRKVTCRFAFVAKRVRPSPASLSEHMFRFSQQHTTVDKKHKHKWLPTRGQGSTKRRPTSMTSKPQLNIHPNKITTVNCFLAPHAKKSKVPLLSYQPPDNWQLLTFPPILR